MLKFGVCDGHAFYRVSKAKPLILEFIPYGDQYQISDAHIRGLILEDVYAELDRQKTLRKIFGSKK